MFSRAIYTSPPTYYTRAVGKSWEVYSLRVTTYEDKSRREFVNCCCRCETEDQAKLTASLLNNR